MDDLLAYAKEGKAFLIAPKESLGVSNHESSKKKLLLVYEKGYSYLLVGEYFVALPSESGGEVVPWREHLSLAISALRPETFS